MLLAIALYFITMIFVFYHMSLEFEKLLKQIYPENKPIHVKVNFDKLNKHYHDLNNGYKSIINHDLSSIYIIRKPGNVVVFKNSITDSKEIVLIQKDSQEIKYWYFYLMGYFDPDP